jgi:hypothetical protein
MFRPAGVPLVLFTVALATSSCAGAVAKPARAPDPMAAQTRPPSLATSVLAGSPGAVSVGVARALFAAAPVVVVASASNPAGLGPAIVAAGRAHAPLLLMQSKPGTAAGGAAAVSTEIRALHPRAVLASGVARRALAAQLHGIRVVTGPARLPPTRAPAPAGGVVLLVHQGDSSAATRAAVATAHVAGAQVITAQHYDPRADPAAITALAAAKPHHVVADGAGFGPVPQLAYRLAVAETGVQLPGGGQRLFPMHRLVAMYGHPGDPALGALGDQDLSGVALRDDPAGAHLGGGRQQVVGAPGPELVRGGEEFVGIAEAPHARQRGHLVHDHLRCGGPYRRDHRRPVQPVNDHRLRARLAQQLGLAGCPRGGGDLVTRRDQPGNQVQSQRPGRSGNENSHFFLRMLLSLLKTRHDPKP